MALSDEMERQGGILFRYRSYIPLTAVFAGVIVFIFTRTSEGNTALMCGGVYYGSGYDMFCLAVCFIGFILRVYIVGYTPANTSGRNTKEGQVADSVNMTGIYSAVRHPLYLANFFMYSGAALLTANFWFVMWFIFAFWVYYERIMLAEEEFLKRKFGESYIKWASETPAFIPSFKHYKKPELSFSWKKAVKKEKNGFAAMFIVFSMFNILGEALSGRNAFNIPLLIITGVSVVLFLCVTYLKRHTEVFNEEGR